MAIPTVSVSDFICNMAATAVLKFKNQTGPTESVNTWDSLRIVVPKAIDLEAGSTPVSYVLPANAAGGYSSPVTGTHSVSSDITNVVSGEFRHITWPMPKAYFDKLATTNSQAYQTEDNVYTIQLRFSQPEDYFNGNMHASVVTAVSLGGTCPQSSNEVFIKEAPVITRAAHTTWTGGNSSNNWADFDNWSAGVPGICSDATI
jgi:hypothetical protein